MATLDPITGLIVIDLQKGFTEHSFLQPLGSVVACNRALLDAFRGAGLPVVLVNVDGLALGRTEKGARGNAAFCRGMDRFAARAEPATSKPARFCSAVTTIEQAVHAAAPAANVYLYETGGLDPHQRTCDPQLANLARGIRNPQRSSGAPEMLPFPGISRDLLVLEKS